MAEILDIGNYWQLVIDNTAKPVETIDEPARGFKAVIGENADGKHVVMNVLYDKSRNTLDDVAKRVEQLRTCSRCQTLDKEKMKIDKVSVGQSSINTNRDVEALVPDPTIIGKIDTSPDVTASSYTSMQVQTKNQAGIKEMFADTFWNAFLTRPGMYFMSVLTGDDKLMENVMPKTEDEMATFMDEMLDFMAGNMEFIRSPEDARDYLAVLRSGKESIGLDKTKIISGKKKIRKELPMMTVY